MEHEKLLAQQTARSQLMLSHLDKLAWKLEIHVPWAGRRLSNLCSSMHAIA